MLRPTHVVSTSKGILLTEAPGYSEDCFASSRHTLSCNFHKSNLWALDNSDLALNHAAQPKFIMLELAEQEEQPSLCYESGLLMPGEANLKRPNSSANKIKLSLGSSDNLEIKCNFPPRKLNFSQRVDVISELNQTFLGELR